MGQGDNIFCAECRVAPFNDAFQVFRGDLGGGDIKADDLEGKFGVREIFPTLLRSIISLRSRWAALKAKNEDSGRKRLCGIEYTYPVVCGRDLVRQEKTAIRSESLQDNGLERELRENQ